VSSNPPPPNDKFGSRLGFILAAAGSAVGLGNVWRFPYMTAENGGAAFVLLYLGCVLLIGIPVLLAELSMGRASGKNAVGAFEALDPDRSKRWRWAGGLGVVTGMAILSFYSVVAGWTLSYAWRALTGTFAHSMTPDESGALFQSVIGSPIESVSMAAAFLLLTALVVRGGVSGGIERASKVLMPAFFVMLVVLAVRALTLPGAGEGVRYLLEPDFSKITGTSVMSAMGQALFSLSLGMGGMITYGAYLQKHERLGIAGASVAFFDTGVALTAGLMVFPTLFAVGVEPGTGGPGVVFVAMPTIFDSLPAGQAFGVAFFALLIVAAWTSTISLLEVVVAYLMGERGWTREKAVWGTTAVCFVWAIPSALSQGAVEALGKEALGRDFLDLMSIVFGTVALTLGALLIAVFVGWRWGARKALEEMNGLPLAAAWSFAIRVVCPLATAGVLIYIAVVSATSGTLPW
jgi:NSS family neurotransmitter:Na+ symporter